MNENEPSNAAVHFNRLHVKRGQTQILKDINLSFAEGKYTAILGANGCGKTTLVRCITGHVLVTSGAVDVLGYRIGRTDIRELRKEIGLVNTSVDGGGIHIAGAVVDADLTTREAVLTGFFATVWLYDVPTEEMYTIATEALGRVGLSHRIGHRFGSLSTGEQRRCMIARALVSSPKLLILDEPTAGLDVAGREQILQTIERVLDQADPPAVIMVTHHVEEISKRADQVVLLKGGEISARGSLDDVMRDELLSDAFGCGVHVEDRGGRYWLEVVREPEGGFLGE